MFERFVYVKLNKSWADEAGRAAVLEETARVLPNIPGVKGCRAGVPADAHAAKGWDICIVLRFDSLDEIESYRIHPDHQAYLEDFLGPKAEAKRVWNFQTQELSSKS